MDWRERDGVEWLEAVMPGARAVFTTRRGGVSEGAFESLNVGKLTDDEPERVVENRGRLADALGRDPEGILHGYQVHGAEIASHEGPPRDAPWLGDEPSARQMDGQATASAGLTPLVQVADCLPVALAGERGVAMLHCGWRGLASGILERGADLVGARSAAVGPGIGPCCFEVGEEVLGEFEALGPGIAAGRMLDLFEVARQLLGEAGIESVELAGLCTSCDPSRFFSHRRDTGRTGRQAGLVWIERDG